MEYLKTITTKHMLKTKTNAQFVATIWPNLSKTGYKNARFLGPSAGPARKCGESAGAEHSDGQETGGN